MPLKSREPDAIDLWFAMQRKAWWKKWWWLIGGLAIILGWHEFSFSLNQNYDWMSAIHTGYWFDPNATQSFLFWERFHYHLHDSLIIPAVLVPFSLASNLLFPHELVAAIGLKSLLIRKQQAVRKLLWLMFALVYWVPMFIAVFSSRILLYVAFGLQSFLTLVCWLAIFLAISEWVVFVTTRQLRNWVVGSYIVGIIGIFILLRWILVSRMQKLLAGSSNSPMPSDFWAVLGILAIATLVSLVALVFLVRANRTPVEYQVDG